MKKGIFLALAVAGTLVACTEEAKTTNEVSVDAPAVETAVTTSEFTTVDSGSVMEWHAAHLGGVQPRYGKIYVSQATVATQGGKLVAAKAVVDMNSFTVDNFGDDAETSAKLAGHLKSGDFFLVDSFAVSTFEMTGMSSAEGDYNAVITGNLTIKDATNPVSFNANVTVADDQVSVQSEKFVINRLDWGLTYNAEGTAGVPADYLISNDVAFQINLNVTK